jgi:hypothetical protein
VHCREVLGQKGIGAGEVTLGEIKRSDRRLVTYGR